MTAALLISFREGLEAALIVGIVQGYLRKLGRVDRQRDVWLGVALAAVLSVVLAWRLQRIGTELEGRPAEIYGSVMMFLAVAVLTWMIYWMRYQARVFRSSLERDVQCAVHTGTRFRLTAIAFIAVFREGVETALFLSAAAFAADGGGILRGALLGLISAIALGFVIYASTIRLEARWFFNTTSVLLLLFAAGLFAHGVHELQEAALLPTIRPKRWGTNRVLDENLLVGQL